MSAKSTEIPHFDPVAIAKLLNVAGDQGAAFIVEMAQLFLDESRKLLADLARARDEGDWKIVSRTAHSLKSSAATLGLLRLSSACAALEVDSKAGAPQGRTEALRATVFSEFEAGLLLLKGLS